MTDTEEMTDVYRKAGIGLALLTLMKGTYYINLLTHLVIILRKKRRGRRSGWEVSVGDRCQTVNFSKEATVEDNLCILNIHTWTRGRLCHFCGYEALLSLTWLCSCQHHTFTQDFIDYP